MRPLRLGLILVLVAALCPMGLVAAPTNDIVEVEYHPGGLVFRPLIDHDGIELRFTGPRKFAEEQTFAPGEGGVLDARSLKDGLYRWEVRAVPRLSQGVKDALARAREIGDTEIVCQLQDEGILPMEPLVQDGYMRVERGRVVDPNVVEQGQGVEGDRGSEAAGGYEASVDPILTNLSAADFVINDDLIVDGSACIGFDCVNGESFGFDTIRLKENNLRIKFDDTSTAASFPRNDWQLTANDSANGGASKFSIDDISGNRTPFTVEANARSHSLYVDDGGRIGSRTSTPSVEIHTIDGDTPTLRLQQDGSSGFAPQTWDVAGNETNFFIRDVTNGSQLPLRIRPDAPTSSIFVDVDGDIGMGVSSIDADVRLQVNANTSSNFGGLRVKNTGTGNIQTQFAGNTWEWRQTFRSGDLIFDSQEDGANEWELDIDGNVTATSFNPTSDRNLKTDFEPVNSGDILDRLATIPVQRWRYRTDESGTPHIGPVAQDFHAAFGVGMDDRHISTTDADGVAFAAIQALYQRLLEKEADLDELRAQNRALAERLEALEAMEP